MLEEAIRLYYGGTSHFASLHLAGAAEEILGAYLRANGKVPSFDSFWKAASVLSVHFTDDGTVVPEKDMGDRMNHAKNHTKHGHGPASFDPAAEAKDLIERAVSNYYALMNIYRIPETPMIARFNSASQA